jgi:hypothetical protein
MRAPNDSTAPGGLRGWWASPPRSGMRLLIAPWEYRHLHAFAAMRFLGAIVAAGFGAFVVAKVSDAWVLLGVLLLAVAAANLGFASWELAIARSESSPA